MTVTVAEALKALHHSVEVVDPCSHMHLPPELDKAVTGLDWEGPDWSCKPPRKVCVECCLWPNEHKPHDACAIEHVWDREVCWPCATIRAVELET